MIRPLLRVAGVFVTAALCVLTGALHGSGPLEAQSALPRLPDGHPDLQGLWMKSAGGFQGLFIGSLDGTNFAAGGRGGRGDGRGAARGPAARISVHAGGRRRAGRSPQTWLRGSRGTLPSARRSARARSARRALSGADHPGREICGVAARSDARRPHHPYGQQRASAELLGVGRRFARTLGGRHAGRGREQLQRPHLARHGGKLRRRERTRRRTVQPRGSRHHSVRGHDHRPNRLRQASTDALHVEAGARGAADPRIQLSRR